MKNVSCFLMCLFLLTTRAALAEFTLIEDFNGYEKDLLDGQGDWITGSDVFEVGADPDDAGNNVMSILDTEGAVDGFLDLPTPLADGTVGTLFFRFRTDDELGHVNFGLSDVDSPSGEWNHFEAQIRDNQLGGLDFRDGGGFNNLEPFLEVEEWFNVWMVIDNNDDELSGYIRSTESFPEQTRLTSIDGPDSFFFRNGTDDPLTSFYIRAGANHIAPWYLDDIYLDTSGENLANPLDGAGGLEGDFNGNDELDAEDIDMLSSAIRDGIMDAKFDLDSDGTVAAADRTVWVEQLRNTFFGDSNLDGEFSSADFVTVFSAGQYEDGIPGNSTWATGDWNGDADFGSSDFVTAFAAGGYEKGPRAAAAVPEPAGASAWLALALVGVIASRRQLAARSK